MPNLIITTSCLLHGRHVEAGSVLKDVAAQDAADLITAGRAVVIEHRAPQIEHRDPKPAKPVRATKGR